MDIPKLTNQVDTTLGFLVLTETEILQENEHRWRTFQQTSQSISQDQVEAWAVGLETLADVERHFEFLNELNVDGENRP